MSILENLKPKTDAPAAAIGPGIQRKLNEVQARLKPLEASQSALALDAELGVAGANAKLASVQQDIAAEKATIARLRLALAAGLERDQAAERSQRAAIRKAQIAALRKHLDARDAAALALGAALETAVTQYKIVMERSRKAKEASPIGGEWPLGAITALQDVKPLVAAELYRLAPGDAMTLSPFPGAACAFDQQGRPDTIRPLADVVKADSERVLSILTGKSAE